MKKEGNQKDELAFLMPLVGHITVALLRQHPRAVALTGTDLSAQCPFSTSPELEDHHFKDMVVLAQKLQELPEGGAVVPAPLPARPVNTFITYVDFAAKAHMDDRRSTLSFDVSSSSMYIFCLFANY